jgi:hypothetical protein
MSDQERPFAERWEEVGAELHAAVEGMRLALDKVMAAEKEASVAQNRLDNARRAVIAITDAPIRAGGSG